MDNFIKTCIICDSDISLKPTSVEITVKGRRCLPTLLESLRKLNLNLILPQLEVLERAISEESTEEVKVILPFFCVEVSMTGFIRSTNYRKDYQERRDRRLSKFKDNGFYIGWLKTPKSATTIEPTKPRKTMSDLMNGNYRIEPTTPVEPVVAQVNTKPVVEPITPVEPIVTHNYFSDNHELNKRWKYYSMTPIDMWYSRNGGENIRSEVKDFLNSSTTLDQLDVVYKLFDYYIDSEMHRVCSVHANKLLDALPPEEQAEIRQDSNMDTSNTHSNGQAQTEAPIQTPELLQNIEETPIQTSNLLQNKVASLRPLTPPARIELERKVINMFKFSNVEFDEDLLQNMSDENVRNFLEWGVDATLHFFDLDKVTSTSSFRKLF